MIKTIHARYLRNIKVDLMEKISVAMPIVAVCKGYET
jgi:hypothetical protein